MLHLQINVTYTNHLISLISDLFELKSPLVVADKFTSIMSCMFVRKMVSISCS